MRGYSPNLILGKQLHPLFRDNIDRVRNSSAFFRAAECQCRWIMQQHSRSANPYYAKYMGDVANVLIENSAIYHHLLVKHDKIGSGATLGKLQSAAFVHGYASPRRVTMYVKRLVQDGRLQYVTDAQDRRIRRLVPCEPILRTAHQTLAGYFAAAEILWPNEFTPKFGIDWPPEGESPWTQAQSAYFERVLLAMGKLYFAGADPLRPFSDVRHFTSKDAGSFLLHSLILASMKESGIPSTSVQFALNYSEVATTTGVSRTHVRNVIEGAQNRGLIQGLEEGGRAMRVTEQLISSFECYFASMMVLIEHSAREAAVQPA